MPKLERYGADQRLALHDDSGYHTVGSVAERTNYVGDGFLALGRDAYEIVAKRSPQKQDAGISHSDTNSKYFKVEYEVLVPTKDLGIENKSALRRFWDSLTTTFSVSSAIAAAQETPPEKCRVRLSGYQCGRGDARGDWGNNPSSRDVVLQRATICQPKA